MLRRVLLSLIALNVTLTPLARSQPRPSTVAGGLVDQQKLLEREKERYFAQASGQQAGTIQRFSVGRIVLEPYNPASDLNGFLVPQNTPVYQGNEKVTLEALVPGASVRIHFRFSPSADQPARAIAVEVLSVSQSRAAKMQAIQSPPVLNQGRGQIPPVPPPEKAEIIADASGSLEGRLARLDGGSVSVVPPGQQPRKLKLDPFVSVFEGQFRVGTDLLAPGRDVRVYFKKDSPKAAPVVIAVDLLKPAAPAPK